MNPALNNQVALDRRAVGQGDSASVTPCLRGDSSPSLFGNFKVFAGDIKIAHTVFALPFALLSSFLAATGQPHHLPRPGQLLLILVCMFTARTIAMAVNRLLDATLDARNPRTARRAIPSGALSKGFYWTIVIVCAIGFVAATAGFAVVYHNRWPLLLSVPVLLFLSAYPLLKRFTRLCHYYLGGALALAPVCAWIAIRGDVAWPPVLMGAAVLCWTAGFDIIYACQDYASDLACGVFSVPARLGIGPALWVSRATHVASAALLVLTGLAASPPLGTGYFVGVGIAILLLIVEHALVRPDDLSKVTLAFFTINGIISVLLGTLGIADVLLH
jgi:4-hydroxybenzoate polyprenyltransferase